MPRQRSCRLVNKRHLVLRVNCLLRCLATAQNDQSRKAREREKERKREREQYGKSELRKESNGACPSK